MLIRITAALLAAYAASVWPVHADMPRTEDDIGKVVVQPRIPYPSAARVLRALPNGSARKNVRIRFEVLMQRVGPRRFYPLVGVARLVETHFKCVVDSDQGREVVFMDISRLDSAK
jgi:hypothetical protein